MILIVVIVILSQQIDGVPLETEASSKDLLF